MSKVDANSVTALPSNATEVETASDTPFDGLHARMTEFLGKLGMNMDSDLQRLLLDTVKAGAYYALKTLRDGEPSVEGQIPYTMQELMEMARRDNTMLEVLEDMSDTEVAHTINRMDDDLEDDESESFGSASSEPIPTGNRTLH